MLVGRLQPVASYRFSRYVLLRPMILKRDARTIKKGWSYQGKLIKLWSLQSKPVPQLSTRFNKTAGAIRSRLLHLQDPTHKAYQRRVKNGDQNVEMLEPDSAPAAVGRRGAESE